MASVIEWRDRSGNATETQRSSDLMKLMRVEDFVENGIDYSEFYDEADIMIWQPNDVLTLSSVTIYLHTKRIDSIVEVLQPREGVKKTRYLIMRIQIIGKRLSFGPIQKATSDYQSGELGQPYFVWYKTGGPHDLYHAFPISVLHHTIV